MADIDEMIERAVQEHIADMRADIDDALSDAGEVCGSPIERLMMARLLFMSSGYGPARAKNTLWPYGSPDVGPGGGMALADFQIGIVPQWEVGAYRADFLVMLAVPAGQGRCIIKRYVVECDGHDFHEKTKQQAARDKARDRFFASIDVRVFRYTGSEIFRNDDELLRDLEKAMWLDIDTAFKRMSESDRG